MTKYVAVHGRWEPAPRPVAEVIRELLKRESAGRPSPSEQPAVPAPVAQPEGAPKYSQFPPADDKQFFSQWYTPNLFKRP